MTDKTDTAIVGEFDWYGDTVTERWTVVELDSDADE